MLPLSPPVMSMLLPLMLMLPLSCAAAAALAGGGRPCAAVGRAGGPWSITMSPLRSSSPLNSMLPLMLMPAAPPPLRAGLPLAAISWLCSMTRSPPPLMSRSIDIRLLADMDISRVWVDSRMGCAPSAACVVKKTRAWFQYALSPLPVLL